MKTALSLRVSQHLALTPQLQQSIRLLQLSTLELEQEVNQALDENPFLLRQQEAALREEFGLSQADTPVSAADCEAELNRYPVAGSNAASVKEKDLEAPDAEPSELTNWDGDGCLSMQPDDSEWGLEAPARGNHIAAGDEVDALELASSEESLQSYLQRQALGMWLDEDDRAALSFLIASLNEDGYLEDDLDSLALSLCAQTSEHFDALKHHLTVARGLLQSFEPSGVGAANLAECLQLQLRARQQAGLNDAALLELALEICRQPLELLAKRDIKRLILRCHASESALRSAIMLICQLEPKPGRRFVSVARNCIVPDVLVQRMRTQTGVKFQVQLNPDVLPRLRVHNIYANALKGHHASSSGAANVLALQQRLQEARWFIKNIQQRFDTILRVSRAIVERQKGFLTHGELAMRPLVLREIAAEVGLHESTISRVTTAKYMSTPYGTYELKYFFGSGLGTESGGSASSTAVRALLKQFIGLEHSKQPLSDNQLSQMLKEQGIACARRTVAKYREALRIAPAVLRKAL